VTTSNAPPALIFCEPQTGSIKVAALTLLDRLVVACHRAGCRPIQIVCAGQLPSLKRANALGIQTDVLPAAPVVSEPTLVANCRLVAQAADVRAVIAQRGRLLDKHGEALPLGLVSSLLTDLGTALKPLAGVRAEGVAGGVTDRASARRMERQLWASLTSSSDGIVDKYFNRPLGRFFSKVLVHTPITPNQVTVVSMLIGLVSAYFFAAGHHAAGILGALLLQLSALVDCVDGDLARVAFKESPLGKWLDIVLDQVVHVAVFAGIAVGLSRQGTEAPVLWLGASAVAGALISFPVVVRGRLLANQATDTRLEKFIDAASTRDFTVLVLFLALLGKLAWFLWLTGVTVHVFWITALCLQLPKSSKARSAA
jgi:phosphatidylglycerophosphate synthase